MLRVGLIYNIKKNGQTGTDAYLEWDEMSTIDEIKKVLAEDCHVVPIEADNELWARLQKQKKEIDIVFNMAEGLHGNWREALVPMMLEELGIPYTGSDPATLMLCLDKERTKQILHYHQLSYPLYRVFQEVPEFTQAQIAPMEFPLIVKPLQEGSSKGIINNSLVMNSKECQNQIARIIRSYCQPALVEEFIPGREFTVAVLGNGEDTMVLPIVELNFSSLPQGALPIYSYEAKWVWDVPEAPLDIFTCPAKLKLPVEKRIKEIVVAAYQALGCRDWCRIDIRLNKLNIPYILELNPIPGILPNPKQNSCFPKAARVQGWTYSQLLHAVLMIACRRCGINYAARNYSYYL